MSERLPCQRLKAQSKMYCPAKDNKSVAKWTIFVLWLLTFGISSPKNLQKKQLDTKWNMAPSLSPNSWIGEEFKTSLDPSDIDFVKKMVKVSAELLAKPSLFEYGPPINILKTRIQFT